MSFPGAVFNTCTPTLPQPPPLTNAAVAFYKRVSDLSRRTGIACARLSKWLEMIAVKVRTFRSYLSQLRVHGWIDYAISERGNYEIVPLHVLTAEEIGAVRPVSRFAEIALHTRQVAQQNAHALAQKRASLAQSTIYTPDLVTKRQQTKPCARVEKPVTVAAPVVVPSVPKVAGIPNEAPTVTQALLTPTTLPEPDAVLVATLTSVPGVASADAKAWAQKYTPSRIQAAVRALQSQTNTIRNAGGFLRRALEAGYTPPVPRMTDAQRKAETPTRHDTAIRAPKEWIEQAAVEVRQHDRERQANQHVEVVPERAESPVARRCGGLAAITARCSQRASGGLT